MNKYSFKYWVMHSTWTKENILANVLYTKECKVICSPHCNLPKGILSISPLITSPQKMSSYLTQSHFHCAEEMEKLSENFLLLFKRCMCVSLLNEGYPMKSVRNAGEIKGVQKIQCNWKNSTPIYSVLFLSRKPLPES